MNKLQIHRKTFLTADDRIVRTLSFGLPISGVPVTVTITAEHVSQESVGDLVSPRTLISSDLAEEFNSYVSDLDDRLRGVNE